MRLGLVVHPRSTNGLLTDVRDAHNAGFRSIWSTHTDGLDALTAMTVAACGFPDLSLVSAVVPIHTRHPMVLAQQAMSVQSASGGRLTLGIGVSHQLVVEDRYGISFDKPAQHMRDYLDVLLPLVRTGAASHTGPYWSYHGQLAVEDASPFPVVLGAMAPQMLALAGSMCDGTIVTQTGPRTVKDYIVPTIAAAAEKAGRPPPKVMMMVCACVTDDISAAYQRRAEEAAFLAQLPSYRAMLDREGAATAADIDIIGSETEVAVGLERLETCGATELGVRPIGDPDEVAATRSMLGALAASD